MKRKDYEKPTMQVVKLRQQTHLLQASLKNSINDWGNGGSLNNDGDSEELTF